MPGCRIDAQGAQHPHAPDAEDPFLLQAHVLLTDVQAGGELAVGGGIPARSPCRGDRRERDRPSIATSPMCTSQAAHLDQWTRVLQPLEGGQRGVERLVRIFLPAVEPHPLVEIPARIEETHADQRHAKVGGCLAMIAGQDSQPTRVDGHGVMEGELGAEVRHRTGEVGVGLL